MNDENLVIDEDVTPESDNSQDSHDNNGTLEAKELRHSQQMEGARKEVERRNQIAVKMAVKAAESNANTLLELHAEDPKLAKEVASKLDFANSEWGSYENFLQGKKKTLTANSVTEEDIERIVQEREAKKEHERALKKAEKIIDKLPEDLREAAKARFDKASAGKLLDEETALEFAEMATLFVSKDKLKEEKRNDGLAAFGSTNVTNSKSPSKEEPSFQPLEFVDGKLVLRSNK